MQKKLLANKIVLAHTKFLSLISEEYKKEKIRLFWDYLAPKYTKVYNKPIVYGLSNDLLEQCDTILILGSNDLAPVDKAVELVERYDIQTIIVSGKGGHATIPAPIFKETEAQTYARILLEKGFDGKLLIESESTNSGENIKKSYETLIKNDLHPRDLVIIQSPASQLRASLSFEQQWQGQWDSYISYPANLPTIDNMTMAEINFHFAYTLRELTTLFCYMHGPKQYVSQYSIPEDILDELIYLYGLTNNVPQLSTLENKLRFVISVDFAEYFRSTLFEKVEADFLNI